MIDRSKHRLIVGADEVGRGPLAGPVVAAAVILDPSKPIEGLADSKKLSEKRREELTIEIKEKALSWSICRVDIDEIDEINILQASLVAMKRAIESLEHKPSLALIDGNKLPELDPSLNCQMEAIIKGDEKEACISAASIIAKVARDQEMVEMDKLYPGYGFAKHKGYPTKQHREALLELGITPIHRRSYAPIQKLLF